jgi:hypothetical protein
MRIPVLALLSAAAIAAPTAASAATTIDGTLAGAIIGVGSSTASIGANSTFSNIFTLVSGTTGEFQPVAVSTFITLSSVTATLNSAVSFTSAFGSYVGTISSVNVAGSTSNRTVGLVALGTFTPTGTLSAYSAGASSLTFSYTQTGGPGSSVSGSFTLASPPTSVPEPMSWALLVTGAGFAGAAARRRRKEAAVA